MNQTKRYTEMEEYLNQTITIKATFQKYGILHGTSDKATLLVNLKHNNQTLDHIWVNSKDLLNAKLRTNQPITIQAKVGTRKRPSTNLYDPPTLDIKLRNITIKVKKATYN